jgi:alpha-L-rhamnosidase
LRVSVPANATAEVWIPAKGNSSITEGGKKLADTNGAKLLRYQDGYAVLETGSGTYDFKTNLR